MCIFCSNFTWSLFVIIKECYCSIVLLIIRGFYLCYCFICNYIKSFFFPIFPNYFLNSEVISLCPLIFSIFNSLYCYFVIFRHFYLPLCVFVPLALLLVFLSFICLLFRIFSPPLSYIFLSLILTRIVLFSILNIC